VTLEQDAAADAIKSRKREHLLQGIAGHQPTTPPGWADVELVHRALPEVDLDDIDLSTTFLGRRLAAPLMIAGMTGGHEDAETINETLAAAAERHGIAMGVGSQRSALRDPAVAYTYEIARGSAPTAFLVGNLGAAQLVAQGDEPPLTADDARAAVDMIRADALAIHLNFLEEVVQPEGDRRAAGCLAAIEALASELAGETPLIAKETGAGLSGEMALALKHAGVRALDVGGRGGTSFAAIEGSRARARGDGERVALSRVFADWGLPTAVSVVAVRDAELPVVATGGVRTGLDAAKALALGAGLVAVGRPMLLAACQGPDALDDAIHQMLAELRVAMFLTGSGTTADLPAARHAIFGRTREWLDAFEVQRPA
jgi:isopentenyl-diphosphate delta-isomerase